MNFDIKNAFQKALKNTSWAHPQSEGDFLLGTCSSHLSLASQDLSVLLAGGCFSPVSGFTWEFQHLDCYLLLYTVEGSGRLSLENGPCSLRENSLILFHGMQHYSLSLVQAPWKFHLYYLTGMSLREWHRLLGEHCFYLEQFPQCAAIAPMLQRLQALLHRTDQGAPLAANRMLTDFFTELSLWSFPESIDSPTLPSHVSWVKQWCDTHYPEHFSLDDMAEILKTNKYKICRDFSAYMHISPLQYLNSQRIEAAKMLLTDTDFCVYEVGNAVGIENTNHFINLFKKFTGTTPNGFRQLHQTSL